MVTSYVADAAVPLWDRALVRAMNDATLGIHEDAPLCGISVLNAEGEVYRRIVAHGAPEYAKLLECFAERGFEIRHTSVGAVIRLPDLAAALRGL